jgi:hypothetical protein
MAEGNDSLGGFLALDDEGRERLRKRIGQAGWLLELGAGVGRALPEGSSGAAAAQVAERLTELLDTPISQVLAAAWSRDPALAKYGDPKRHPAGEVALVPLADHTVTSSHRPSVELLLESAPLGSVEFQVDLAVTLRGALIGVRDGRIMELRAGRTTAEARLGCAGTAIAERRGELKLPGVIRFGEGIAIAPAPAAPPPVDPVPEPW